MAIFNPNTPNFNPNAVPQQGGGILGNFDFNDPRVAKSLMGLGAGLLQSSGYSNRRVSMGEALGNGLQGAQQGLAQHEQSEQRKTLLDQKREEFEMKKQDRKRESDAIEQANTLKAEKINNINESIMEVGKQDVGKAARARRAFKAQDYDGAISILNEVPKDKSMTDYQAGMMGLARTRNQQAADKAEFEREKWQHEIDNPELKQGKPSAAEQKIARLQSVGMTEEDAIKTVDGVYDYNKDVMGRAQVVDMTNPNAPRVLYTFDPSTTMQLESELSEQAQENPQGAARGGRGVGNVFDAENASDDALLQYIFN